MLVERVIVARVFLSLSLSSRDKSHPRKNPFAYLYRNVLYWHFVRKAQFRTRLNKKACAKSSFAHVSKYTGHYAGDKVILTTWDLSPSHRSGAKVHTRIKSLSRTGIEMYYFTSVRDGSASCWSHCLTYHLIYDHAPSSKRKITTKMLELSIVIILQYCSILSQNV